MNLILALFVFTQFLYAKEGCDDTGKYYRECADQEKLFSHAFEKARDSKRSLLILVGADYCPGCKQLHKAFEQEPLKSQIGKEFDFVKISRVLGREKNPSGEAVMDRLMMITKAPQKPKGYPLLVFLNPVGGKGVFLNLQATSSKKTGFDPQKLSAEISKSQEYLGH